LIFLYLEEAVRSGGWARRCQPTIFTTRYEGRTDPQVGFLDIPVLGVYLGGEADESLCGNSFYFFTLAVGRLVGRLATRSKPEHQRRTFSNNPQLHKILGVVDIIRLEDDGLAFWANKPAYYCCGSFLNPYLTGV
jgi:hypothetical protein